MNKSILNHLFLPYALPSSADNNYLSQSNHQNEYKILELPGDFLSLYFHAQNAAIVIEIDESPLNQPLISSWQVSLPTETITSSLEPHISYLSGHSQLISRIYCELLVDFMNNTIEHSISDKSSNTFDEMRDVPIAHYVCQWWKLLPRSWMSV